MSSRDGRARVVMSGLIVDQQELRVGIDLGLDPSRSTDVFPTMRRSSMSTLATVSSPLRVA